MRTIIIVIVILAIVSWIQCPMKKGAAPTEVPSTSAGASEKVAKGNKRAHSQMDEAQKGTLGRSTRSASRDTSTRGGGQHSQHNPTQIHSPQSKRRDIGMKTRSRNAVSMDQDGSSGTHHVSDPSAKPKRAARILKVGHMEAEQTSRSVKLPEQVPQNKEELKTIEEKQQQLAAKGIFHPTEPEAHSSKYQPRPVRSKMTQSRKVKKLNMLQRITNIFRKMMGKSLITVTEQPLPSDGPSRSASISQEHGLMEHSGEQQQQSQVVRSKHDTSKDTSKNPYAPKVTVNKQKRTTTFQYQPKYQITSKVSKKTLLQELPPPPKKSALKKSTKVQQTPLTPAQQRKIDQRGASKVDTTPQPNVGEVLKKIGFTEAQTKLPQLERQVDLNKKKYDKRVEKEGHFVKPNIKRLSTSYQEHISRKATNIFEDKLKTTDFKPCYQSNGQVVYAHESVAVEVGQGKFVLQDNVQSWQICNEKEYYLVNMIQRQLEYQKNEAARLESRQKRQGQAKKP